MCVCALLLIFLAGCEKKKSPSVASTDGTPAKDPLKNNNDVLSGVKNPAVEASSQSNLHDKPEPAIAIVNGERIAQSAYDVRVTAELAKATLEMPQALRSQFEEAARKKVLDEMILETILVQKVREKRVVVSAQELQDRINQQCRELGMTLTELQNMITAQGRTMTEFQQRLRLEMAFEKAIEAELDQCITITDDEMKTYHLKFANQFKTAPQIRLAYIYLRVSPDDSEQTKKDTEAVARELLKRLEEGNDFSVIARAYSDAPSASQGGDTGYIERGTLEPEAWQAASLLETGQISDVIAAPSGYHIIKMLDRREPSNRPYEDVTDEIRQILMAQKRSDIVGQYLHKLKENATIVHSEGSRL